MINYKLVKKTETCWLWLGRLSKDGYGKDNEGRHAHRSVYSELIGPIPRDLELDHLCRVRNCVNPAHLEPVTGRVNRLRSDSIPALNFRKTHCCHGHALSGDNVRTRGNRRVCKTCDRHRHAAMKLRRKAA